jgi:transcriptional regulator with XRE-family HTH domain
VIERRVKNGIALEKRPAALTRCGFVHNTESIMSSTNPKPGMPFAESSVARYLDKQIEVLKGVKTQREIAAESGYENANMISMFKRGEVRVPLDKIPLLAKSLHVDPGHLFRLALEQYWPSLGGTIVEIFGRVVTANEEEILIKPWREATRNRDPESNIRIKEAVERILAEIAVGDPLA